MGVGLTNKRGIKMIKNDAVNNPKHYTSHPSGIEYIQITEHMGFNLGNAIKYIWRSDLKDNPQENISKAIWYLKRELLRIEKEREDTERPMSLNIHNANDYAQVELIGAKLKEKNNE